MKINKILIKVALITTIIAICSSCICYAAGDLPDLGGFKPTVQSGKIIDITNTVLGVIISIGVILITVFIAITGFSMILGSVEEKAVAKEKISGYLIAVVVLTSGATIAKVIISVAESF